MAGKETRGPEVIRRDVYAQLSWDNRIDESNITVEVADSRVILSGTVPTYPNLMQAERDAYEIPGVKSVENRLRVLFPTTYPTPGDARIEGNIRALLETNPAIDARNIRVSSLNNVVTLTGSVATDWQKGRAGYIAVNVEGVLELRNELRVVPRGARADVDIEKDIEDSLARNAFIRPGHVRVEVRSGAVVLSGTVDDYQEYRTAERIASHTNGVVGVTNSLAIR